MWELRFRGRNGAGRALYVQDIGRSITVLTFFQKKSRRLPKSKLDLAVERRKGLEEANMETRKEDSIAVEPIDAQREFETEYADDPERLARFNRAWTLRARRIQRMRRVKTLWGRLRARLAGRSSEEIGPKPGLPGETGFVQPRR